MSIVKKNSLILIGLLCVTNIFAYSGDCRGTYIQVSPETFANNDMYSRVPYINFTAQANRYLGDTTVMRPFYKTWTPDGYGTRPYTTLAIHNSSLTQSVSFYLCTSEDDGIMNPDTKLWVGGLDRMEYITWKEYLDDDHGGGDWGSGSKITLAPGQGITIIISLFSSYVHPNAYFGVYLTSTDIGLKPGYPEAIIDANGDLTIIR